MVCLIFATYSNACTATDFEPWQDFLVEAPDEEALRHEPRLLTLTEVSGGLLSLARQRSVSSNSGFT